MPSVVNKKDRDARLFVIEKTWGVDSHAIFILDENTQASHNFDTFPDILETPDTTTFPKVLHIPFSLPEEQGVKRLSYILTSIYSHVNPDFVFFVNDHTYVLTDNLVSYLTTLDARTNVYAGHALKPKNEVLFNSGAAGYILSRTTLSKLVHELAPGGKCSSSSSSKWINGNPGLAMAKCIQQECGVRAFDTRDGISHRFHAFGLVRTVTSQVDEWYVNYHRQLDWYAPDQPVLPSGTDCCSSQTITFHYVEYAEAKALFDVRTRICQKPFMSDEALKLMMMKCWPNERSKLGFYSRGLPESDNEEVWRQLLHVMRKISGSCSS